MASIPGYTSINGAGFTRINLTRPGRSFSDREEAHLHTLGVTVYNIHPEPVKPFLNHDARRKLKLEARKARR